jgi:hypothetical protein
VESNNTGFWIATILAAISALAMIAQAIYAALSYHKPKGVTMNSPSLLPKPSTKRFWIMAAFPILAWLAVGFDYYGWHRGTQPFTTAIVEWNAGGQPLHPGDQYGPLVYTVTVDASSLQPYKDEFNALLIVRIGYANIDRPTDTMIEKSVPYTIENRTFRISHPSDGKLRYMPGQPSVIEFNLALIPKTVTPDQITRLQDVTMVGGMIVQTVAQIRTVAPATQSPATSVSPSPHGN